MKRRNFIRLCGLGVLLAGCGSTGNNDVVVTGTAPSGPANPNAATSALPTVARVSTAGVFGFDSQGNLYEVQPVTAKVSRVSPAGQVAWTAGSKGLGPNQLNTPVALSLDTLGRAWVLDRGLGKIVLFDAASGALAGEIGAGQLGIPQDVALSSDRAYVSDAYHHRVAVFNLNGQSLGDLGREPFNYPRGLAVDQTGRIHVVDATRSRIVVLTPDGQESATYGGPGAGQGRFAHPRGLAIRAVDGVIAVVDSLESDIELFSPSLQSLGVVRPDVQPLDVQFGPDGLLYVSGVRRA